MARTSPTNPTSSRRKRSALSQETGASGSTAIGLEPADGRAPVEVGALAGNNTPIGPEDTVLGAANSGVDLSDALDGLPVVGEVAPTGRQPGIAGEPNPGRVADWVWPMDGTQIAQAAPDHLSVDPAIGIDSYIDAADWNGIAGWAWSPLDPARRIVLELLDGDTVLTTIRADQYREDLQKTGMGDGFHAFSVSFGETVLPYARHVLHLRVAGSAVELPPFPLVLTRERAGFDATVKFVLANVIAEVERSRSIDDVAPIIAALLGCLDRAVARYADLTGSTRQTSAALLKPNDFAPAFRTLVSSLDNNYPPISLGRVEDPVISIIIPVFNNFKMTYDCVKSIVEQGAGVPFEIIIVDDCSRDETVLASFVFSGGIRLVRNAANQGFIRSCNGGFDAARGKYVVFLNNDTVVKPHWLDELYQTVANDPTIGIVGAKLLSSDGTLQESGGIVWRLGDAWNWGRGESADDPRFCYLRDADYVSGACLMLEASLFAKLGKFDELYLPMYYEDTDLCFRARQLGYRVVVQPMSEVIHLEGASAGTSLAGIGMKRYQAINHRKFLERWKEELTNHRFNGELPEFEAERAVRRRALFIDDSVPEPDKDAGSNAALQHMVSLQRLGYKVTFIPADNMARIDPYTGDLQRRGIECRYSPYYSSAEEAFRKGGPSPDLVYLHRYSNASKYGGMIRLHFPQARILYNVADLHFLRAERQAQLQKDPQLQGKVEELRRLELRAMAFVDCVIVHSATEAALLREIAPDIEVKVIPWTIPLRQIAPHAAAARTTIGFIGGFGHPPNVDAALWTAQSVMPELRKRVPGVKLLFVGSRMPAEISALAASDIVPLGYVPSLDSVFGSVRLTIAPLRYGAGLKGKVLESMAAGVPCVMTQIAAEGICLPTELQWLVTDDPREIAERVAILCRDDAQHHRAAEACKAHVMANYSAARIDQLIREACGLAEASMQ